MELKGREIISLPIIDKSTGTEIGEVKNFLYSIEEKKLKAVIVEDGGWLWGKNLIFLEDIESIGKDALIIATSEVIVCSKEEDVKESLKCCGDLLGHKVISNSGEDCGVVEDLVLNVQNGRISGLEISNGLLADLIEGRSVINFPKDSIYGDKTIILGEQIVNKYICKE